MFKKIGIAAALCLTMGMTVGCTSLSNVDEEANIAESIEKIAEDVAGEASSEAATEVSSEDTDDESAKEASEADEKSSEAATSASSKASVKDAARSGVLAQFQKSGPVKFRPRMPVFPVNKFSPQWRLKSDFRPSSGAVLSKSF